MCIRDSARIANDLVVRAYLRARAVESALLLFTGLGKAPTKTDALVDGVGVSFDFQQVLLDLVEKLVDRPTHVWLLQLDDDVDPAGLPIADIHSPPPLVISEVHALELRCHSLFEATAELVLNCPAWLQQPEMLVDEL